MTARLLIAVAAAAAVLAACDDAGRANARAAAVPAVAPPRLSRVELLPPRVERQITGRVEVRDPLAVPATQTDAFVQSDGIVDILWVIDDSGSMKNQRKTLTDNFERFVEELLELHTTFQMGVISTNALDRGELRGPTAKIITEDTLDAKARFVENTTFPDVVENRWEQGLRMIQTALTSPAVDGPNAGFLRPGAALAAIVVTDEDDGSFGDPAHYARFLRHIKGKGNENLVSLSVIGGTTPSGCYPPGDEIFWDGRAEPAFRYAAVATRTGGVVGSICDPSFENTLIQIAQALSTLRRVFPLSLVPADPSAIVVRVNGVIIPRDIVNGWVYRPETGSIAFLGNYLPPPAAQIRIDYAIEGLAP